MDTLIKRIVSFGMFSVLVVASSMSFVVVSDSVRAASCTNTSNYGVATMTVTVPATGEYRLWSRMKIPSASASTYQLEVDGNTCWQVGGSNVPTNTWTWVDWYGSNATQKVNYTFTSAGSHTLKLIGSSVDVQVDKVILLGTGEKCSDGSTEPSGDGVSCATGPAATATNGGSTGTNPVAGETTPTIVSANQDNAVQTSYVIDGKVVQTSNGAAALDTTKLEDGTYEVQTVVKLKDGSEVSETQTITVQNKKSLIQKLKVPLLIGGLLLVVVGLMYVSFRFFFRGDIAVLSEKLKSVTSKNESPVKTEPNSEYLDPEIIKPTIDSPPEQNKK